MARAAAEAAAEVALRGREAADSATAEALKALEEGQARWAEAEAAAASQLTKASALPSSSSRSHPPSSPSFGLPSPHFGLPSSLAFATFPSPVLLGRLQALSRVADSEAARAFMAREARAGWQELREMQERAALTQKQVRHTDDDHACHTIAVDCD